MPHTCSHVSGENLTPGLSQSPFLFSIKVQALWLTSTTEGSEDLRILPCFMNHLNFGPIDNMPKLFSNEISNTPFFFLSQRALVLHLSFSTL